MTAAALIDTHRPTAGAVAGIGAVLADSGYLSTDNLAMPAPDRLIAVAKSHDLAVAAREDPAATGCPPIEAMAHRLRTIEGRQLYKQRNHIAETPIAHAKTQPRVQALHQPRTRQCASTIQLPRIGRQSNDVDQRHSPEIRVQLGLGNNLPTATTSRPFHPHHTQILKALLPQRLGPEVAR